LYEPDIHAKIRNTGAKTRNARAKTRNAAAKTRNARAKIRKGNKKPIFKCRAIIALWWKTGSSAYLTRLVVSKQCKKFTMYQNGYLF
jgi:hypothetical protein